MNDSTIASNSSILPTSSGNNILNDDDSSTWTLMDPDFSPTVHHVIIGRGKKYSRHPGNLRFTELVHENMQAYSDAENKAGKSFVISQLMARVRETGNFVREVNSQGGRRWALVEEHAVRTTCAQHMRDALHSKYRSSKEMKKQRRKEARRVSASDKSISSTSLLNTATSSSKKSATDAALVVNAADQAYYEATAKPLSLSTNNNGTKRTAREELLALALQGNVVEPNKKRARTTLKHDLGSSSSNNNMTNFFPMLQQQQQQQQQQQAQAAAAAAHAANMDYLSILSHAFLPAAAASAAANNPFEPTPMREQSNSLFANANAMKSNKHLASAGTSSSLVGAFGDTFSSANMFENGNTTAAANSNLDALNNSMPSLFDFDPAPSMMNGSTTTKMFFA